MEMKIKKGKKLKLWSPFLPHKDSVTYWADVHIKVANGKGRVLYLIPTLVSKRDLEIRLENYKAYDVLRLSSVSEEVKELEELLIKLNEVDHIFGEETTPGEYFARVYSSKDVIDREEAERLCMLYAKHCGVMAGRVKWERVRFGVRAAVV